MHRKCTNTSSNRIFCHFLLFAEYCHCLCCRGTATLTFILHSQSCHRFMSDETAKSEVSVADLFKKAQREAAAGKHANAAALFRAIAHCSSGSTQFAALENLRLMAEAVCPSRHRLLSLYNDSARAAAYRNALQDAFEKQPYAAVLTAGPTAAALACLVVATRPPAGCLILALHDNELELGLGKAATASLPIVCCSPMHTMLCRSFLSRD